MVPGDRTSTPSGWASLERYGAALAGAVAQAILSSASPSRALVGMVRLLEASSDPCPTIEALLAEPRLPEILATLFSGSHTLTQVLLRRPEEARTLSAALAARRRPCAAEYVRMALEACAQERDQEARLDVLRAMRAREQLRIGCADLLGLWDLATVTDALSSLAEGLIGAVMALASGGQDRHQGGLAVLALGKLGGHELNYSSDIDLVFVSDGAPASYDRLSCAVVDGLSRSTSQGYLYRVDLRLRPWGRSGSLVADSRGYLDYLRRSASLGERQALLKARTVAGDRGVGDAFLAAAAPVLYGIPPDVAREGAARTKRAIEHQLTARAVAWGEVKQGAGSIRDVEFVTQYLQLREGGRLPQVRGPNTMRALAALRETGVLPDGDYRALAEGYAFLRPLEHALQLLYYAHTHQLPRAEAELDYLARRLGFTGEAPGRQLVSHYEGHSAAIRAVYAQYLLGRGPTDAPAAPGSQSHALQEHVRRMSRTYRQVYDDADVSRHVAMAGRLSTECLAQVNAKSLGGRRWSVEVVARDYPGELSLICGLMLASGLEIEDGQVFSSEDPSEGDMPGTIVDAFTVCADVDLSPGDWARYAQRLQEMLGHLEQGRPDRAHGLLARLVAEALSGVPPRPPGPLGIVIENPAAEPYTVLTVEAPDARGFLYELAAALALGGYQIVEVSVRTAGGRAHDVLYITDAAGRPVREGTRQDELRATVILAQHLTHLLPASPDPERALRNFRGFLARLFAEPGWPRRLSEIDRPDVLTALARLLGVSDYLWEDLLRVQYDALLPVLRDVDALARRKDRAELERELRGIVQDATSRDEQRDQLNAWRDREMFRIDMRHIQGYITEFGAFSEELGDLAEVVLAQGLLLATDAVERRYGTPRDEAAARLPIVLCGLGKLAGREMGYASDVEVLFVQDGRGRTDGAEPIPSGEFWERVVQEFLRLIQAKRSGIFAVDLRLRPYGSAGSLAPSLDGLRRYYAPGGPAWPYERQAMVRLRPIAGDADLAARVVAWRDEAIFRDEAVNIVALRSMRERQLRHLVAGGSLNAKYSAGGLVDVEYLVQTLQIRYGARVPKARNPNTLQALGALVEAGALSTSEGIDLREAYVFLRRLIDALRMVRGNAQDLTVPQEGAEEWLYLSRRMGLASRGGPVPAWGEVRRTLEAHMAAVSAVSRTILERESN